MRPIDPFQTLGNARTANPVTLLALAIGVAVGAMLSGGSARSAEIESGVTAPQAQKPLTEDLGTPKPVRVVPVPAPTATTKPTATPPATTIAPTTERYSGDDRYRRCLDESDGTNPAYGECGSALIEREDRRMNEAWKRVYMPGSEAKSQELLTEQRAWLAFRDASCTLYLSGRFGREGQVLSYPVCRAAIIAERAAALDAYGDPEGR